MLSKFKSNISAPLLVALVYLLLILSRIINIPEMTGENEYIGVIVLQLLIFLLPAVVYSKLKGEGYALRLRIRPIGGQHLLVALLGAGVLVCGSLLMTILFGAVPAKESFSLYKTFTASFDGSAEAIILVSVAYAVVPALCEEFFFRSILSAEYEEYGIGKALLMSSLFFGMVHYDLTKLPIYFFAGCVLFATMYATRSLIGSIIVHLLYNLFGLFGEKFASEVYNTTGSTELFLMLLFGVFLLLAALFCGEAARLYRKYARLNTPSEYIRQKKKKKREDGALSELAEILLAPPALACYLIFILSAWLLR